MLARTLMLAGAATLIFAGGGCSSKFKTELISQMPSDVSGGIYYYLPKTVVRLQVEYELAKTTEWFAGKDGKPDKTRGEVKTKHSVDVKSVAATPILVPDTAYLCRVDLSELNSATVAITDGIINLTDSGLLSSVNVPFADKTADIAVSVVKTGISIAAAVTVLDVDPEPKVSEREVVRTQIATVVLTESNFREGVYSDLERAKSLFSGITNEIKEVKVVLREVSSRPPANAGALQPSDQTPILEPTNAEELTSFDGAVVRIPKPYIMETSIGGALVDSQVVSLPQHGPIAYVPISSKRFTNNSVMVKLSATSGAVTEVKLTTGSSGQGAAKAAEDVAAQLAGAKNALLDAQKTAAEKEAELLKKEKELEEAKRALEEARKKP